MTRVFKLKLQTCRYWAFGVCPNVDANGIENCQYAHWDTGGPLSDVNEQRGTCAAWLRTGSCLHPNCYYEHRDTGYLGLYQGRIELSGLDLQVADAAATSGFNTRDQAALIDLIWAMRRIERTRRGTIKGPRPPKHSVYPDRYRPCGIGDNTQRKRKRCRVQKSRRVERFIDVTKGTQEDPITLDDEDEDSKEGIKTTANSSAKRQRTLTDDEQALSALNRVKNSIAKVTHISKQCQNEMHIAFNSIEKIRHPWIGETLKNLNTNFTTCSDAAILAVHNIEKVIEWVDDDKDGIW